MLQRDYEAARLNPDKPIELNSEDDKLSFNKIVESVIDLLKLPERPFTFGLFGKWGTGKSTILGEVEKRLDGKDYYVVTFDAWKYEGDALRRSFLISVADQLNTKTMARPLRTRRKVLSDNFVKSLKEDVYKDKSVQHSKPEFKFRNLFFFVGSFLVLLAAEIALALKETNSKSTLVKISPLLLAFVMGLAAFIVNALSPSSIGKLLIKEINVGTDKLSSPEEFYNKFLKILQEIEGKTLLVIIDNLDRTQKAATVELLGTIKTFLNSDRGKEDVVFLVASDHKAIKRHIKEAYSTNSDDAYEAEEFIKKFFNAVIEIPPFISSEYRTYLIDLLEQSGIGILKAHQENMISIISAGYPDNPRGAKQFVNSLVVYLVMLSQMGHSAGIEQKFIENNLNFIAALLVIRDRFDELYDSIQEQSLKYEYPWEEIKKTVARAYADDDVPASKRRDFRIFYNSIESWVSPESDSLKWFFNMRRSIEEQKLPNWDAFVSSIEKKDQEQAIKYLVEFSSDTTTLNTLLEQHIRNVRNEASRWTSFCTVFIGYLTRTNPNAADDLQGSVKEAFRFFPSTSEFSKFINQINCQKLIELLEKDFIDMAERSRVRTAINGYLRSGSVLEEKLLEIIQAELASASPNSSTVKAISDFTSSNDDYPHSAALLSALVELDGKHEFITRPATEKLLQSLTQANIQDDVLLKAKLSFIKSSRFLDKPIGDKYVELMTWLHNGGNQLNRSTTSLFFYDFLKLGDEAYEVLGIPNIQNITQYVINWFQQIPNDYSVNRSYVTLLALMSNYDPNPYAPNAKNIVQQFVSSAPVDDLLFVMKKLETNERNAQLIMPGLKERILHDRAILPRVQSQAPNWITDILPDIAFYLVTNAPSLNDENRFIDAIDLSKEILSSAESDNAEYESKIYETFEAALPKFKTAVSAYVYKRNGNILAGHSDWLLNLKRRIKQS